MRTQAAKSNKRVALEAAEERAKSRTRVLSTENFEHNVEMALHLGGRNGYGNGKGTTNRIEKVGNSTVKSESDSSHIS